MTLSSPEVIAARARAALAFANIKLTNKGAPVKVGSIGQSTMARILSPTNPRGASVEELWEIADACGVPRAFMEEGFTSMEPPLAGDLEGRVAALEDALRQVGEPVDPSLPQSLQDAEREAATELTQPPSTGRAGAAKRRARGK